MAKKKIPKTEKEWKDWGEHFGEQMKQRGTDFAEEIEEIGERFEKKFEEKKASKEAKRICRPFGIIWPLIGSVFGLVMLIIGISLLNWLNIGFGSSFIPALTKFLSENLSWLFVAGLFFGYARFFVRNIRFLRAIFSPIIASASITFTAWIMAGLLLAINVSAKSSFLEKISNFLSANLFGIFIFFLLLGYAFWIVKKIFKAFFWE